MKQIRKGLENDVDVYIYANLSFDSKQMGQIRLGLETNLNVSKYAKPEYNWEQMSKIRRSLLLDPTETPIIVKINPIDKELFE